MKDKYLLENLWIKKVPIIPIVIVVKKRLVKGLEDMEIRGRVENIQITTLLKSA